MKIGYVRVSTEEQNTARQEILMKELGVEKIFIDKKSGKNTDRPQLKAMFEFIREGDTLVVSEISRLARDTRDFLYIIDKLTEKGVQFESQKEKIDTTTPAGQLMLTIFAALSQFERENTLERQREGIAAARAEGRLAGRPRLEAEAEKFRDVYDKWKKKEITARAAMKELNMKPNTFYRRVKEYETE